MKRRILKKKYKTLCRLVLGSVAFFGSIFINQNILKAMPADVTHTSNNVDITKTNDTDWTIGLKSSAAGKNGFQAWSNFSLGKNDKITFGSMSNMLNYVAHVQPSVIYGQIDASAVTGNFYIINPSGILFGPNSVVKANNFFVSTRSLTDAQIASYVDGGANYSYSNLFINNDGSLLDYINDGGLKSSDIMGIYDVADGDVMFLGKVQANKLTVEGNTIQIRNTANIKNSSDSAILQGNAVTLYSKNYPEIGYEVTSNGTDHKYWYAAKNSDDIDNSATHLGWKAWLADNIYTEHTINNYRLITSANDLNEVNYSRYVDGESSPTAGYVSGNYMLNDNIDMSSTTFTPLGYAMNFYDFIGEDSLINFNGLNFTINGLKYQTANKNSGLFAIFNGTIKNLRLSNATLGDRNGYFAGGLIGSVGYTGKVSTYVRTGYYSWSKVALYSSEYDNSGTTTIKNVAVKATSAINGTLNSSEYMSGSGGMIGVVGSGLSEKSITYGEYSAADAYPGYSTVIIENVENYATVTNNDSNAGGIVGLVKKGDLTIKNSANHGRISGAGSNESGGAGGIVGKVADDTDNYDWKSLPENKLTLDRVSNDAYIDAYSIAGGLVGYLEGYDSDSHSASHIITKIENSWNEGNIEGGAYLGGIIGQASGATLNVNNVFNSGNVTSYSTAFAGGLIGSLLSAGEIKNAYNTGNISIDTAYYGTFGAAGIVSNWLNGNITNVYNSGNITGGYAGGLVSSSDFIGVDKRTLKNAYNVGTVTQGYYSDGNFVTSSEGVIVNTVDTGTESGMAFENVYTTGTKYAISGDVDDNNRASGIEAVWDAWNSNEGTIDKTGGNSSAVWRVYQNPSQIADKARQPLLTTFMLNGEVTRYSELNSSGSITPYTLLTPTLNMHPIHDSSGTVLDVRYKNNAKSAMYYNTSDSKYYYYLTNPNLVSADIIESSDSSTFSVSNTKYFAKALLYSSQFGYNFDFDKSSDTSWGTSSGSDTGLNTKISTAGNSADANAIYLKLGIGTPPEPTISNPVDDPPDTSGGDEETVYEITLMAYSGVFHEGNEGTDSQNTTWEDGSTGSHYRVTNSSSANLSGFTIEFDDGMPVDANGKILENTENADYYITSVKVTYNNETYTIRTMTGDTTSGYNGALVKNDNGTYTLTIKTDDTTTYKFTIRPGTITSTIAIPVTLTVGDITETTKLDGTTSTSSGTYTTNNTTITNLLNDVLTVVDNGDGKTSVRFNSSVTVKEKDSSTEITSGTALTTGTTYTITKDSTTYEITKTGTSTFTYAVNSGNGEHTSTYTVTISPGTVKTVTEKAVTITVGDGTVSDGVLTRSSGYTVSDQTVATALGNLTVKLTGSSADDYKTTVVLPESTKQNDGTYVYSVTSGNATTNYIITVTPGNVTTGTFSIYEVTVTVDSRTKNLDGTLNSDDTPYTISGTNSDANNLITGLISGKVKVTEVNGKVTLTLSDGVTVNVNGGTYTYEGKTYTITKDTTGTNTVYTVTTTEGGNTTAYKVTLVPGSITPANHNYVTINVGDGTKTNGTLSGGDYTTTGTLPGNITVGKATTTVNGTEITVVTLTYTDNDGNKHVYTVDNLTQDANGNYIITIPISSTSDYIITIDPGAINTVTNTSVTVSVGDGTLVDGVFTGTGYTVGNTTIAELLSGVTVTYTSDGKTVLTNLPAALTSIGNNQYTYTVTDANGNKTIYTITIDPGDLLKTINTAVTVKVGDGTLNDGVFTDSGYTVGNTTIATLLSDVEVTYTSDGKTILTNLPSSLTANSDGTYRYTVTDSSGNVTNYTITINPGDLLKTINTSVTISVGDGTLTDGVFTNTGYTVGNTTIAELFNGVTVTYTSDGKTILTNLPSGLTPNSDGTYSYTVTDSSGNKTVYTITIDPGILSIINTPTITYTNVTISVGDGTLIDGVFTDSGYNVGNPIIAALLNGATITYTSDGKTILTNLPSGFTSNGDGTYNYTVTDENGNQIVYVITIDPGLLSIYNTPASETDEEPDVELRSSNVETFTNEKGDYVDLDLQDHTLIEVSDTNVEVNELDATPDEFTADAQRNVVDGGGMEFTTLSDTSGTSETQPSDNSGDSGTQGLSNPENIGGGEVTETPSGDASGSSEQSTDSTSENSETPGNGEISQDQSEGINSESETSQENNSEDQGSQETNSESETSQENNSEDQGSQESNSESEDSQENNSEDQESQESNSESEDSQDENSEDENSEDENSDEESDEDENENSKERPKRPGMRPGDRRNQNPPGQPPQGPQQGPRGQQTPPLMRR